MKKEIKKTESEILQNLYQKRVQELTDDINYFDKKLIEAQDELKVILLLINVVILS